MSDRFFHINLVFSFLSWNPEIFLNFLNHIHWIVSEYMAWNAMMHVYSLTTYFHSMKSREYSIKFDKLLNVSWLVSIISSLALYLLKYKMNKERYTVTGWTIKYAHSLKLADFNPLCATIIYSTLLFNFLSLNYNICCMCIHVFTFESLRAKMDWKLMKKLIIRLIALVLFAHCFPNSSSVCRISWPYSSDDKNYFPFHFGSRALISCDGKCFVIEHDLCVRTQ